MNYVDDMIESKLLNLHTTYLAKVISVNGNSATVQPLQMIKQMGKAAQKHAPIPNVPISSQCKGRVVEKTLQYVSGISNHSPVYSTINYLTFEKLKKGDIVVCCCGERDITQAKQGKISTPTIRRHSLSDSVIMGVL